MLMGQHVMVSKIGSLGCSNSIEHATLYNSIHKLCEHGALHAKPNDISIVVLAPLMNKDAMKTLTKGLT